MAIFAQYRTNEWELFIGNALMLATALLYLVWWRLAFWPGTGGKTGIGSFMVAGAMLSGVLSLVVVGIGIASTPLGGRGAPTIAIILGAALSYFVLIAVTTAFFHRVLTAELLVIVVWAAVELLVVNALYACGRFAAAQAVGCVAAVALASLIGLACYVLYYRLNGYPSFWDGLVPLAVDALATAGLLFAQAASKAG